MNARVIVMCVLCVAAIAAAPFIGGDLGGETGAFVLTSLRIPRVLMACMVGAVLSLVGACYQTIFANPLAAPSTVGTTAGATMGAMIAVLAGGAIGGLPGGLPLVAVFAFLAALGVSLFVAALAGSGRARVNDVLLAGIAISLATGAVSAGLQFTADQMQLFAAVQWSLGHLPQVNYRGVAMIAPFVLVTLAVLLAQTRALQSLAAGEDRAHSQGVNVPKVRGIVLGVGALGVAACVAWCGPIAFVGLIVPHMVRMGVGSSRRVLLPMSVLLGAAFLTGCDTAARLVLPGRELPVGVLTAGIGAPLLVWLVARGRR
ncbi:MAG: iron ABC transporter permease [Planctomycetes bacterium]|nr:iron ABC transporter permease [Planctomycetota bacterium]MCW8137233.1 iron ABC transporter permease [Planctomycetota bacterium]